MYQAESRNANLNSVSLMQSFITIDLIDFDSFDRVRYCYPATLNNENWYILSETFPR